MPATLGYAAVVRIAYHMMSSPVGLLFLARSERGLRYLQYMDRKSLKRMIALHAADAPEATWEPSLLELKGVVDQLETYFNGLLRAFEGPLDLVGSEFQLKVWSALRAIPFGETRTYGEIAKSIRQPKATRAVGLANNQNPIAIVVPCHRVIGANGTLTGYGGGLPRKKWLLQHESSHVAIEQRRTGDLFAVAGREPARRGSR
jgi:methylated-DNA-[protein]-cysteine S-methyltransferase